MIDNYDLTVDGILRQINIENEDDNSSVTLAKTCHYFYYYNSFDETPMNELRYNLMTKYDVVTFFDSLEHCEDIEFIKDLNTKYILISVPWCHWKEEGDEWFMNWKHRKPNEHLYHFDESSLLKFMKRMGYLSVDLGNYEDVIRKPVDHRKNILTGLFKKI